jgi:hypothetical protein
MLSVSSSPSSHVTLLTNAMLLIATLKNKRNTIHEKKTMTAYTIRVYAHVRTCAHKKITCHLDDSIFKMQEVLTVRQRIK